MDIQYIHLRDVRYVIQNRDLLSQGRFYLLVADSIAPGILLADDDASCRMIEADPDTRRPLRRLVEPLVQVTLH